MIYGNGVGVIPVKEHVRNARATLPGGSDCLGTWLCALQCPIAPPLQIGTTI
jgi:hypothetical protein